jgi:hypothetical protein
MLVALGPVAGWGILESVLLAASLFTLIEAGGLVIIIVAGFQGRRSCSVSAHPATD